ncbi:MAG: glucose 1-dehydrogenase [Deltaproteobacteria bacterium]|nr:glucose 1-dehydrogenase [Deltaproteobacteria bacterium]
MAVEISSPSLSLKGKVAIITGGGTGIGRGIALAFAGAGADVVVCGRRIDPLEEVAGEIQKQGKRSIAIKTDVSNKPDVDNLVLKVIDEFGHVDILVNNAANSGHGPSMLHSDEDRWNQIINTNLKGTYYFCRAVAEGMRERKQGNIINISSIDGMRPPTGGCRIYGISKAAINYMTRGMALELAEYNIRVNAILPGAVKTDFIIQDVGTDPANWKALDSIIPLGRVGQPVDIGSVALFLASNAANYITGQLLVVDAGVADAGIRGA